MPPDARLAPPFDSWGSGLQAAGHPSLAGAACGCPVCAGEALVVEEAAGEPQGYLNADQRAGVATNGKPSYSIDQAADQIVRGEPGWSYALGVSFTVTYAYRATAPAAMPDDISGFSRFNSAQIAQTELALRGWSDVARIAFVRLGSGGAGEGAYSDQAAILFANYSSGSEGASAFAFFPGSTSASSNAGDVWVNVTTQSNVSPSLGDYGAMVLAHEIGHAIGLAHPSEYDAGPDVAVSYRGDADYYEDSRQYTVMSYFSEANTGANFQGAYAAAPLLDDIAAAQLEYGANYATRTGDTVYGFNATADRPWFAATSSASKLVFAVWDAGGTDTFDFSGYGGNQLIDLRAGSFSDVGGLEGNVAVAQGVAIENARGGIGSDLITGTSGANGLWGGAGHDTIAGGEGRNYLRGEDGDDRITGGSNFDDINGNMGDDDLSGGPGDDWVVGGKEDDRLWGDGGGDIVWGNLGNDTLEGGDQNDQVRGGQGDDLVAGGDGDDWLAGDRGNDTLTGGAGADLFHTWAEAGIDRVTDFDAAQGDRVLLLPGTFYAVGQAGSDTVLHMGGGGQMILANVQLWSLPSGWIFDA